MNISILTKYRYILVLMSMLVIASSNVNATEEVFTKSSFEQIKLQYQDQQWLMVLWSVDCPACFKELALIQQLLKVKPDIKVVIINADDNNEVDDERKRIIDNYQLTSLPNYYFADGLGDQLRFIIDSNWYGELPRSYFVEKSGQFHGKSGLLNEELLKQWLWSNTVEL